MDEREIRLACLQLAHGASLPGRDAINVARQMAEFVLHGRSADDRPEAAKREEP